MGVLRVLCWGLGLAAFAVAAGVGAADSGGWPVDRGSPGLTGFAAGAIPAKPVLRWRSQVDSGALTAPVVSGGSVIVGSASGYLDCLDAASGRRLWRHAAGEGFEAPPLAAFGMVVAGTVEGSLVALDAASGDLRWVHRSEDRITGGANAVTIGDARYIVFGTHAMRLHCLAAASGDEVWSFEAENYINATPAVFGDRIVFGGCDGKLRVLAAADGASALDLDVGAYIASSVAVVDGDAILGHYGGEVLSATIATGEIRWRFTPDRRAQPFFAPPAVTPDRVVIGSRDRHVYGLDRNTGAKVWAFRTKAAVDAGAVADKEHALVGSTDGRLYLLRLEDGREVWNEDLGAPISVSPAVAGGILFVSTDDGFLHAFGPAAAK